MKVKVEHIGIEITLFGAKSPRKYDLPPRQVKLGWLDWTVDRMISSDLILVGNLVTKF